jgi:hypothetical protein
MIETIVGESKNEKSIANLFGTRSDPGSSHAFGDAAMVSRKKSSHHEDLFSHLNLPKEILDAMLDDFSGICDGGPEGCRVSSDKGLERLHTDRMINSYKDAIDVTRCHWHAAADPVQDAAGNAGPSGNPGQPSLLQKQAALRDAVLSDLAYDRNSPDRLDLPDGIIELGRDELPDDVASLMETESGYAASLFFDSTLNRVVIANRGTEGFMDPDGVADLRQAMGLEARQYTDAIKLAEKVHDVFGKNYTITTTGHSLGGGLASVQALYLGTTANTFNAAGVHADTLQRYGISPELAETDIHAYYVEGEVLSELQDSPLPDIGVGVGMSIPKLFLEIMDEYQDPDAHDFNLGVAHVPEALGQRTKLPAVSVQQNAGRVSYDRELSSSERARQSFSLHGIRSAIASLQFSIDNQLAAH